MYAFLETFFLVVVIAAAISLIVGSLFTKLAGEPSFLDFKRLGKKALNLDSGEKARLAKQAPFAVLMGALAMIALGIIFPATFGHPLIASFVFAVATAMTAMTLPGTSVG